MHSSHNDFPAARIVVRGVANPTRAISSSLALNRTWARAGEGWLRAKPHAPEVDGKSPKELLKDNALPETIERLSCRDW